MNKTLYNEFLEETGQDADEFELEEYRDWLENETESLRLQLEFANAVIDKEV